MHVIAILVIRLLERETIGHVKVRLLNNQLMDSYFQDL